MLDLQQNNKFKPYFSAIQPEYSDLAKVFTFSPQDDKLKQMFYKM